MESFCSRKRDSRNWTQIVLNLLQARQISSRVSQKAKSCPHLKPISLNANLWVTLFTKSKHKHLFLSFAHTDRVEGHLLAGSKAVRTEDTAENQKSWTIKYILMQSTWRPCHGGAKPSFSLALPIGNFENFFICCNWYCLPMGQDPSIKKGHTV